MKRKIFTHIFALGLLLSFGACQMPEADLPEPQANLQEGEQHKSPVECLWLAYNETQCSDPWGYCNKDPEKLVCVKEHLANMGVEVLEATVSGSRGDVVACMACQCPSGRVFKVKVKSEDVPKLEAIGFKKI